MTQTLVSPQGKKYREYSKYSDKPLFISLHGSGQLGSDPTVIDNSNFGRILLPKIIDKFTVIAPQQTKNYSGWQGDPTPTMHDGAEFVDWIISNYPSDGRCFIIGHSMGGHGVWDVATFLGKKITAFVAISGNSDLYHEVIEMSKLHIPARHYHGKLDTSIPYSKGQQVCNWYKPENGDILFPYDNKYHDIDDDVYKEPDLIDWFLSKGIPNIPQPPIIEPIKDMIIESWFDGEKINYKTVSGLTIQR